ncbi:MAG: ABC transporter ATP-binding protein [Castellaniella sp.]|nr:ABC transporter ATP-binding protein [Castellaniella sp.]
MSTAVRTKGLSKRFGTGVLALTDIDLDVETDTFVSLVGPSGCGKSTLLRLLAGLIPASTGMIEVGGVPVSRPVRDASMVFQQPVLLDWRTVLDNVLFTIEISGRPVQDHRARALELLALTGLSGFEHHYPYQLSGGMQQRVALCRALITEPSLILMDEPFAALDVMTRERLGFELQQLLRAASHCTVLFVTHSITEAVLLSDRVVVLTRRPGRVQCELAIDLPRPRVPAMLESPEFIRLTAFIRAQIGA